MKRCILVCAIGGLCLTHAFAAVDAESAKSLTYRLDTGHSNVAFRIKHFDVGYVYGLFRVKAGKFHLDPSNEEESFVEATVVADSLTTNHEARDKHLKSADYFDVAKHVHITFKSTKIKYTKDNKFLLEGKLNLLGVKMPIQVEAVDMGATWMAHASAYQRGMTTTFTIDRTKFGMTSEHYLGDEVEVFVSLEGGSKKIKK